MVDPDREPLEGVVEVDQTEIPFREGDAVLGRGNAGKIRGVGAVEVIDRDTHPPKSRRKHAKDLDTRSGRVRRAMIATKSGASIEAFVKANEKRNHADDGWPRVLSGRLSGLDRLSERSTHRRQDGGPHCLAVD
jgi:hypothetical protein